GEHAEFSVTSDGMPTVVRYFSSFTDALDEVKNARVFGGIHFRTACNDGQMLGNSVGDYVLTRAMLRVNGQGGGQLRERKRNWSFGFKPDNRRNHAERDQMLPSGAGPLSQCARPVCMYDFGSGGGL